jgi:hypothetical protein
MLSCEQQKPADIVTQEIIPRIQQVLKDPKLSCRFQVIPSKPEVSNPRLGGISFNSSEGTFLSDLLNWAAALGLSYQREEYKPNAEEYCLTRKEAVQLAKAVKKHIKNIGRSLYGQQPAREIKVGLFYGATIPELSHYFFGQIETSYSALCSALQQQAIDKIETEKRIERFWGATIPFARPIPPGQCRFRKH